MALDQEFSDSFKKETWALYSVGVLAAILRSTARIKRLGIRNLQLDDYLIVVAVVWYTILCVALNRAVSGGGSNLMTEEEIRNLTPEMHKIRTAGSKWVFVSEHFMVLTIWTLKSVMLLIYARITNGLGQRRLVNYCAVYVAVGFVVSELSLFLICRPLSNYWAVPTPNYQCSSYQYYEIVQGIFAITADIFMLLIAIPLLMAVRLPWRQKIILVFLFGLGIFVIVAAILTKVYCLVPELISYVYMSWYFREATVAMLVTCLPLTWSLLRDVFPSLKSWAGGSRGMRPTLPSWSKRGGSRARESKVKSREFNLQTLSAFKTPDSPRGDDQHLRGSTIVAGESTDRSGSNSTDRSRTCEATRGQETDTEPIQSNRIRQDVTITIQTENDGPSDDDSQRQSHFHQQHGTDTNGHGLPSFERPRS